ARIGKTISPISGRKVTKDSVSSVVDHALQLGPGESVTILAPLVPTHGRKLKEELSLLLQKGFVRVVYQDQMQKIESVIDDKTIANQDIRDGEVLIGVDRVRTEQDDDTVNRLSDSVQTGFFEGKGELYLEV